MRRFLCLLISFLFFLNLFAQQRTIRGRITDATGAPLRGATVAIRGTSTATVTDDQGNFTIPAATGNTLVVSYLGQQREIAVTGSDTLSLTFSEQTQQMSEVVVTAMGIRRDKKALGYAVSTVDKKQIESRPDGDIARLLTGKAPGVDILASSGISGSGTAIQIRGANSITGGSDPLFVVDGAPFSGATNSQTSPIYGSQTSSRFLDIDPNNIESVSVLKGLSATVLYGEQGRNGVILITTKNGAGRRSNKKAEISVAQSYFHVTPSSLPETQKSYGGGFSLAGGFSFFSNWGPKFTNPPQRLPHPYSVGSQAAAFPELAGDSIDFKYNDNFKAIFKDGHVLNTAVNVNAALGASGTINASYGHLKDQGFLATNSVQRNTFGLGLNTKLLNNITVGGTMNFVLNNFQSPTTAQSSASGAQSGGSGVFADVMYTPVANDLANWPYQTPDGASAYYRPTNDIQNPLWTVYNSLTAQKTNRIYGNFNLRYNILKNLDIMYRLGYDSYNEDHILTLNKGGKNRKVPVELAYERGIYRTIDATSRIWDHSVISQYQTNLNQNLRFDLTAGFNSNERKYDQVGMISTEQLVYGLFDHSNFINHDTKSEDGLYDLDYREDQQSVGVFAQAGLGFKEFLYLNLGGRNSWTSTVEKANRSLFYPSASVSFIPTTAFSSLANSKMVNYIKLRAGYATSANFPDPYNTRPYNVVATNIFVDRGGAVVNTNNISDILPNRDLKPELLQELETGLEAKLLNNRFSIDFTWYNRKSTDQILNRPLDPSTGYGQTTINAGDLVNKGIELGLGYTILRGRNFTWQLDANFTRNRSKITDLPEGITQVQTGGLFSNVGNFAIEGQPFGVIKGQYWLRDEETGQRLVGQDGYYIPSTESKIIGDPNQDYRLSGISTLGYKGLELRVQMDYFKGGVIYATTVGAMLARGLAKSTDVDRAVPIILPGVIKDNNTGKTRPNNIQTAMDRAYFNTYLQAHEQFLYDATTIRLRDVSLSYALPQSLLGKTPIGGVSIALTGQNLWHMAPYFPKGTNYDPESSSGGAGGGIAGKTRGFEYMTGPQTRRYGATLKVTF